jgi:hypothetical protein
MGVLLEILVGLFLERLIIGLFGYYTLWAFFKVTRNPKGIKWLDEVSKDPSADMAKGCFVTFVGLVSAGVVFFLFAYLFFS